MSIALCRGFVFLGRAHGHAQVAPGAVLGCDLDRVPVALVLVAPVVDGLEGRRSVRERRRWIDLGADRGVRADQRALLHWMQIASSQTGIWAAMLRFSQRAVPVGHVPSPGTRSPAAAPPC